MPELRTIDAAFTIESWDETVYDEHAEGPKLTRVTIRKRYAGVIDGSSVTEVLTAQGAGSGYVASERVVGTLEGREGTFVIQHSGLAEVDGAQSTAGAIVPGSGTGAFAGIAGEAVEAVEAQQQVLSLRVTGV